MRNQGSDLPEAWFWQEIRPEKIHITVNKKPIDTSSTSKHPTVLWAMCKELKITNP